MSAEKVTYVDSSAIVKLAFDEPESAALRRFLRRRTPLVSSALARVEVVRTLLPLGADAVGRANDALVRIELIRISERVLRSAGEVLPVGVRSLDAIHVATARDIDEQVSRFVTYDARLAAAAESAGFTVVAPT
jgi:predicted nucleic acid-binding protein